MRQRPNMRWMQGVQSLYFQAVTDLNLRNDFFSGTCILDNQANSTGD